MGQEITGLERWAQRPEDVDLLVLSHFDDDHVNGVERLLSSRRVRVLALPYLDIGHRLAGAGSVSSEACSASTAAFQLDPVAWLHSRGLSGQVDTLLLVQSGRREDGDPPIDGGRSHCLRDRMTARQHRGVAPRAMESGVCVLQVPPLVPEWLQSLVRACRTG
ncbi:MAG: MBL fold metallo-hydrolase [Piscinibacter sp.]